MSMDKETRIELDEEINRLNEKISELRNRIEKLEEKHKGWTLMDRHRKLRDDG